MRLGKPIMSDDLVRYRRSLHVHEEPLDGELALLHLERAEIRSLNEVATILWEALAEPDEFGTVAALVSLLAESHPDTPVETHREHVERFFEQLESAGLVERVIDVETTDGGGRTGPLTGRGTDSE